MYSRIAPDSQRVIPVFGSSMAGRRPLGLILMKDSDLGSAMEIYNKVRFQKRMDDLDV